MSNAFIRKLSGQGGMSAEDIALLEGAYSAPRTVRGRQDHIRTEDKPGPIFGILESWACRYKILPEGTRQITAFLMPGDCCDMHASVLDTMEHSIATVTRARVATNQRSQMEESIATRPALTRAFWWTQLIDEYTLHA